MRISIFAIAAIVGLGAGVVHAQTISTTTVNAGGASSTSTVAVAAVNNGAGTSVAVSSAHNVGGANVQTSSSYGDVATQTAAADAGTTAVASHVTGSGDAFTASGQTGDAYGVGLVYVGDQ
jgi:hypothetical protein